MVFRLLLFRLNFRLAQAIRDESTSGAHLLCSTKVVKSFSAINFQPKTLRFMHNKSFTRCHKNHFQRYPDNSATFTSIPPNFRSTFCVQQMTVILAGFNLIPYTFYSAFVFATFSLPNNATRTCV